MRIVGGGMADRVLTNVKACVRSHPVQMEDVRDEAPSRRICAKGCLEEFFAACVIPDTLECKRTVVAF